MGLAMHINLIMAVARLLVEPEIELPSPLNFHGISTKPQETAQIMQLIDLLLKLEVLTPERHGPRTSASATSPSCDHNRSK